MKVSELLRVLVVEDDHEVRRSIVSLLRARGWEVVDVGSGNDALRTLTAEGPFDLILTDYRMPEMTGLQFLVEVRNRGLEVPVVLCTGYALDSLWNSNGAPFDGMLRKPFSWSDLEGLLSRVFRSPRT